MRRIAIVVGVVIFAGGMWGVAQAQQAGNPITNGGFEKLGPDGFPVDWERVGREVLVTHEAHSGRNAVLMRRTQEAIDRKLETGLNRAWKPHSGQQGKMLAERKGGVIFWYKVPRAPKDAWLRFYMIPMTADPIEGTGAARQWFQVPVEHFGDGKWHKGMVAYDFTDVKKCKWVQVSPRVISKEPAEWIIDDVQWVESIGPLAQVAGMRLREVKGREGRECEVAAVIKNIGDKPLGGVARLVLPAYLKTARAEQRFGPVKPQDTVTLKWRVTGLRDRPDVIRVQVRGGAAEVAGSLKLAPALGDTWAQIDQFILWPGKETTLRFVVQNTGTAAARNVRFSVELPREIEALGPTVATVKVALPGTFGTAQIRLRARGPQTKSAWIRCRWQAAGSEPQEQDIRVIVAARPPRRASDAPRGAARVACDGFEIVFPRNDFGYGVGWVYARPGGELVGAIPWLARVVIKARDSKEVLLYARRAEQRRDVWALGLSPLRSSVGDALRFVVESPELQRLGLPGPVTVSFTAGKGRGDLGRLITWQVSSRAPRGPLLLALEGPTLCFGEGAFGADKDEGLYPGLEWLVRGEMSSSALDIAADHPHRIRHVVHPHMVTVPLMAVRRGRITAAVLWHSRSAWNDGRNRPELEPDRSDVDRPAAIFASPDRFRGHASHCMGLMVPTVPEYVPVNETVAEKPWPAEGVGARGVRLLGGIYVNGRSSTVLDAMRAWFDVYGVAPPRNLPHTTKPFPRPPRVNTPPFRGYRTPDWLTLAAREGKWWNEPTREQWIDEIEWSMQAYLKTLWDDEERAWLSFKGGPRISLRVGPHASFLYDCVIGAMLTDDPVLREKLRQRIALIQRLYPGATPRADDMGLNFGQPVLTFIGLDRSAASLAKTQDPDGGWRFHPYIAKGGVFKGRDYSELGYEGQEAIGLVARKAWTMLRAARMTGDQRALQAGLKALRYMEKFIVPRAAQVWEVPVHTPDILAASDACEAYLEAYYITGERKWLERAVYWEEAGLPFLYQWDVDAMPWLRYASIPVFGATWMRGSWFGRAVQWNGLRWAFAALKLAEVDDTYPWRMLAAGVTISAIYQQGDGENDLALWPDSISAIDQRKSGWIFAPRSILKNVYKLLGYEPEPVTATVKLGGGTVYVNACGRIKNLRVEGEALRFTLVAPEPIPTRVVIFGLDKPRTVSVDGQALEQRALRRWPENEAGWRYHNDFRVLEIAPEKTGRLEIRIQPAAYREPQLVPPEVRKIDFGFDEDAEGWMAAHDLEPFRVAGGLLLTRAVGPDPYMTRVNCRVDGDSVSRIHVRMAVSAGIGAEFYWTTADSPRFAEDKTVKIGIKGDGQFHDYYFDVGKHEMWRGHTVTGIRLDPMSGAKRAEIKIDFIRGEP